MRSIKKLVVAAVATATVGSLAYGISTALATPSRPNGPTTQTAAQLRGLLAAPANLESVYVPLSNCRLVNTGVAGGRIPAGSTRNFQVTGTAGFPGQGGTSGGCGVPTDATAVSARLTGTGVLSNGAFVAFPTGTPTGQGTLYYAKGLNLTTGLNLQIGTGGKSSIKNVGGSAFTIIDVNGYWVPQIHAVLSPSGGIYAGSPRVLSSTNPSPGHYTVTVDRDLTGCTPIASVYGGPYYATAVVSGHSVFATTYYGFGANVGTPLNLYWSLTVDC